MPRATLEPEMAPARWPKQPARLARIEHHRHVLRFHLAGIEAAARPFRRRCGRSLRRFADRRHGGRWHGHSRAPCRCLRRPAPRRRCCGWCRHSGRKNRCWWPARWREREKLAPPPSELVTPGTARPACSASRARATRVSAAGSPRILQIELGNVARQKFGRRKAGEFVLRRQPRHRQRARRQRRHRLVGKIAGGDEGDAMADKNAQAQIGAFAAFDIFQPAQPVGNAGGDILDQQARRRRRRPALRAAASRVSRIFWGSRDLDMVFRCRKGRGPSSGGAGSSGFEAEQGRLAAHRVGDIEPLFLGGEIDMQVAEHIHARG